MTFTLSGLQALLVASATPTFDLLPDDPKAEISYKPEPLYTMTGPNANPSLSEAEAVATALDAEHYKTVKRLDCFGFAMQKKAEGKVKHVGFSFHDSAEVLDQILTEHPEACLLYTSDPHQRIRRHCI